MEIRLGHEGDILIPRVPMSSVPMRQDGIPEFVIKALYVLQWCSDTISEITSVFISLIVSRCASAERVETLREQVPRT